jgi:NADPH:quinone reductase
LPFSYPPLDEIIPNWFGDSRHNEGLPVTQGDTMKAIRFHTLGGPEVLQLEEVEKPRPAPGEALVKVRVAGVNFADTLLRQGRYVLQPSLPEIPGFEASGVVETVGAQVDASWVGRRVAFMGRHCYAEYAVASAGALMALPDSIPFEEAAAFPIQSLTAYHLLHTMHQAKPGMTVLVHAAAGGVGLQLLQMAKQAGARVFGTVSTEEKAKLAREYGADEVILYTQTDFAQRVMELTGGRGVELVLDSVGRATFARSLRVLAPFGHLIVYGAASGLPEKLNVVGGLMPKSLKVSSFWLFTMAHAPEAAARGVRHVLEAIAAGKLKLPIGLKLPLEQAAEAHRQMEARQTVGKILLTVS